MKGFPLLDRLSQLMDGRACSSTLREVNEAQGYGIRAYTLRYWLILLMLYVNGVVMKHCLQYMYRKANRFLRAANQQITQMLREKKPLFQLVESSN